MAGTKKYLFLLALILSFTIYGKELDTIPLILDIKIQEVPKESIQKYWLQVGSDGFNKPITVPVLIAKGKYDGPVLGLTAALHGNELNGIPIIQNVFKGLNLNTLKGTVIAIPGLNPVSIFNDKRRFIDDEDLNRLFPGKKNGNRSQQIAYQINEKILKLLDFHVDMHTASFGRINSLYARADMSIDTLATMAKLQNPDIILSNKGVPSFGNSANLTMRASALQKGAYSITVEYGDPQVYQLEMINRGTQGIQNLMVWLNMVEGKVEIPRVENVCSKSYWIYTNQGGLLDVKVGIKDKINKGQLIGVLKDPFGSIIEKYFAPEDGIVIGKSTNPVNMAGGRILHLGILQKEKQ
jgi:predicted deacylase